MSILSNQKRSLNEITNSNMITPSDTNYDHLINTGLHDPLEQARIVHTTAMHETYSIVTQPSFSDEEVDVVHSILDENEEDYQIPRHHTITEILERPEIIELMEILEKARFTGKIPAISFQELKDAIREATHGQIGLENLVEWGEDTWLISCPSQAIGKVVARPKGKGRRWYPITIVYTHQNDENCVDIQYNTDELNWREIKQIGNILQNNDLKEARVNKNDKTRIQWRSAKPGMGRHKLVGTLFYRLLKVLSGKCLLCDHSTYIVKEDGTYQCMPPNTLNEWHMAHEGNKERTPTDCLILSIANAIQEYKKCHLERVERHDQREKAAWKKGAGVPRKRKREKAFHIPVKEVLDSDKFQNFITQLDEKDARSQAKIPKITFQELENIVQETLGIALSDIVDFGEAYWNTPEPNNKAGKTGHRRREVVQRIEYSALKVLSGACASCSKSVKGASPDSLSGWHMDHIDDSTKLFEPANGITKNIIKAREEWAKCALKCSACHHQGVVPHWKKRKFS